jgi:DNA-binding MarR family transcriptional regulator
MSIIWYSEAMATPQTAWSHLLHLLMNQRGRFHQAAERHDLSAGMAFALLKLHRNPSMRALAETLHCDRSNVTGLVKRLEERKLVRRVPDPNDGRSWQVTLTPAGTRLRNSMKRDLGTPPPEMKKLSAAELRTLSSLLERLAP